MSALTTAAVASVFLLPVALFMVSVSAASRALAESICAIMALQPAISPPMAAPGPIACACAGIGMAAGGAGPAPAPARAERGGHQQGGSEGDQGKATHVETPGR